MAKIKPKAADVSFACRECGDTFPKWTGKCPSCGCWDSLVEFKPAPTVSEVRGLGGQADWRTPAGLQAPKGSKSILHLKDVPTSAEERLHTGLKEFDRVLGGGVVRGSLVLIGGDPGIGKSTLLLQVASTLTTGGIRTLYVTGEESLQQLRLRASRLRTPGSDLLVASETNLEAIFALVDEANPEVLVLDSIQTVYKSDISASPGSPAQLREATLALMVFAKSRNCAVFLVGHVTKEGQLAGPRLLEHMVDTVIYFEGERHHAYRILRAVKNRFGATHEIGVFEMRTEGLVEVENPSEAFISHRESRNPGSVVTCCLEGSRPLLIEVQALVGRTNYAVPQRVSMGLDQKRLTILLAILEKSAGIEIGPQDVFVNLAGGFRIDEPAIDLAVAAAVASNHLNKAVLPRALALGELGLNGELRPVPQLEARLKEAQRLGFTTAVIPMPPKGRMEIKGMELRQVRNIADACENLLT